MASRQPRNALGVSTAAPVAVPAAYYYVDAIVASERRRTVGGICICDSGLPGARRCLCSSGRSFVRSFPHPEPCRGHACYAIPCQARLTANSNTPPPAGWPGERHTESASEHPCPSRTSRGMRGSGAEHGPGPGHGNRQREHGRATPQLCTTCQRQCQASGVHLRSARSDCCQTSHTAVAVRTCPTSGVECPPPWKHLEGRGRFCAPLPNPSCVMSPARQKVVPGA
jgi:hypothetical protein